MHKYQKQGIIGEGAHGVVYKACVLDESELGLSGAHHDSEWEQSATPRRSITASGQKRKLRDDGENAGRIVAIKKIRLKNSQEGLSMDAIREIKLLQELEHPNIMKVLDIFNHESNINIVMDFCTIDLEHIVKCDIALTPADVKSFMKMILLSIEECHSNWILHRDIKPSNFLLGKNGQLRLADFGLAKVYGSPDREMSHQACTLWYRAPELLFGARSYGVGADMWSIGCVFAELLARKPFFQGHNELSQLSHIFAALGTPTPELWPGMEQLPQYTKFNDCDGTPLQVMFAAASSDALDLLSKLLVFDPAKRVTAKEALQYPYFSQHPPATLPEKLPVLSLTLDKNR